MKDPFMVWVLLLLLSLIFLCIDVALVSGQCQSDQRSLLLQLKDNLSFNHSKSTRLVTWDSNRDCCEDWHGVQCDTYGRVIGLDLSNESISGWVQNSTGLFGLKYLRHLNLAFNHFNTTMPIRFANLTELEYMNLSSAGFMGQIPIQISRMARLVTLDLSMSSLYANGSFLKLENPNLASLVRNLTMLRLLYLDGINLSADGKDWCQAISTSLPDLQELSLIDCSLSGPIDTSLAKLQSLSVIRLKSNSFSAQVPDFIANFKNLTELYLSSCGLLQTFPQPIFQVPSLKILDLSNNGQLQGSFPEFHQNLSLQVLLLSDTNFSGTVPQSINNLRNLSRVEIARCKFTGQIPSSMTNLTQLVYLDFSNNMFTGQMPSLHMSKNLTYLDFSKNQLSGEIPSSHFEGHKNLSNVDLSNNSFNGNIPSSLFAIPSLQKIQLSVNQFGGTIPVFSNASLPLLNTLDLSSNNLVGPIPNSVFHLGRLNILSVSSNKLNGSVYLDWVRNLGNLTSLDLSRNNLTVEVTPSNSNQSPFPQITTLKLASCNLKEFPLLGNQSKLYYLDLSDNDIHGPVPPWLQGYANGSLQHLNLSSNLLESLPEVVYFPKLDILDVHKNQLQGNIPLPPPYATYVDYSDNNFTSSIPMEIGNSMSFTLFFSLANNNLTGFIPASICRASYLQILDLSNNSFSGAILPCLIENITTLGVLNLRRNNLNGTIPNKFQATCRLQTLDLSRNLLQGTVPQSLANCTMLEVLDLGNNRINDEFPCILKHTTSLRVLVLRSNQFHGQIGCSDCGGNWSKLQIVDLASNKFNASLSEECLLTWKAMMGNGNESHDHIKFESLRLSGLYYQDSITVTIKGLQMELVKILTVFTSIDFSNNTLNGVIPEAIGEFKALYLLNLSHNSLSGPILSSIGNLSQLESLDLSVNNLTGEIPQQLAGLTFLSFLNLSHNKLVGRIPTSTQLQSFSPSSFEDNAGLCGPPLPGSCLETNAPTTPEMPYKKNGMDWQFILRGMGFGVGAAAVVAPLIFSKEVNKWFDDQVDRILMVLLPMIGFFYHKKGDWRIEPEESFSEDYSDFDEEEHGDHFTGEGKYCVFCTKLDITMKRVVHDLNCTCYLSPPNSSSTSSFSSSVSVGEVQPSVFQSSVSGGEAQPSVFQE